MEEGNLDYRLLFESSAEGMLIAAGDGRASGRIIDANPEACRITRKSYQDLTTAEYGGVFDSSDPRLERALDQLRRVGRFEGKLRLLRRHGEPFAAEVSIAALAEGKVGIVFRDATERAERTRRFDEDLEGETAQQTAHPEAAMPEADDYEGMPREAMARLHAIFEQAAVGMALVGLDGRWLLTNRKLCAIVGYAPEELLEKTSQDMTHPDDLRADLWHLDQLLAGKVPAYSVEKRYLRKDGSIVWTNLTVSLVRDPSGDPEYLVSIIEDIDKRKRTEGTLHRSETLYRTVVEQAAENIFLVDADTGRVVEANAALYRSLGYSAEEFGRVSLYDIVAHDRHSVDSDIRRVLEEGHRFVGDRAYRRKDGSLVDVEVAISAIPYDGRRILCIVAHDITKRKQAEEGLRQSLRALLALREAGLVLGSTLESEEIVSRLLEIMRHVSGLTAAVVSLQDEEGRLRVWRSAGLQGLWSRARYMPEAENARRAALENEEQRLFELRRPDAGDGYLAGLCIPLRTRGHTLGVLEAYGPRSLSEGDTVRIVGSLTNQAASALENARLYEELEERERRLQGLVGKLLSTQEEERRRVAYEVHDGLAQVAAAAHQHLQAFARRHFSGVGESSGDLERVLRLVRQTVSEARRIIANLRPTALDDFGLAATISLEVERLREDGYLVDYEAELGEERLPATIEIALFRVAQEALMNIRKHAQTWRIRVGLWRREDGVYLETRDWGRGFIPNEASTESGPGERVGLAGMRERVGMLGGNLEIHSQPGAGTRVAVRVPVPTTNRDASTALARSILSPRQGSVAKGCAEESYGRYD